MGSDEDQAVRLAGFKLQVPVKTISIIKEAEKRAEEILMPCRDDVQKLADGRGQRQLRCLLSRLAHCVANRPQSQAVFILFCRREERELLNG
jgi:hypothetical protein